MVTLFFFSLPLRLKKNIQIMELIESKGKKAKESETLTFNIF